MSITPGPRFVARVIRGVQFQGRFREVANSIAKERVG